MIMMPFLRTCSSRGVRSRVVRAVVLMLALLLESASIPTSVVVSCEALDLVTATGKERDTSIEVEQHSGPGDESLAPREQPSLVDY